MNSRIEFDFYGVRVGVSASTEVLSRLSKDFEYFQNQSVGNASAPLLPLSILIEVNDKPVPEHYLPKGSPLFRTKACEVYGMGEYRVCVYRKESQVSVVVCENEPLLRKFQVFSQNADHQYELAYLSMLSVVGEALDKRGFHRIHALGFSHVEQGAGLVLLPHGGGKSAMTALLLKESGFHFFSDETPLVKGSWVYPFPVRMALSQEVALALGVVKDEQDAEKQRVFKRMLYPPKLLFSIPSEKVAEPQVLRFVFVGSVTGSEPVQPLSRMKAFAELLQSLVVGVGVAQMTEFMFRPLHLHKLVWIAFSRLFTAIGLCLNPRVRFYAFAYGQDAFVNTRNLIDFLKSTPKST